MVLSDFHNGYTSVSLYSQYSLTSHSVRVAEKNVLDKKLCCANKNTLPSKIMWVTKNMLWQQKKLCETKKETHIDYICLVLHRKEIHVDKKSSCCI